jgi:hypothetical protein
LLPLLQRLQPSLYIGQADLYRQVASIDSSILAADRRYAIGGPVNDPGVQPWQNLLATCGFAVSFSVTWQQLAAVSDTIMNI